MKAQFKRHWLWFLVGVLSVLCIAGTKISRLTRTTYVDGNALIVVVTNAGPGGTRAITVSNFLDSIILLTNWPPGGVGSGGTNIDLNVLTGLTNVSGTIYVQGPTTFLVLSNGAGIQNSNSGFRRRVAYWDSNQKLQPATVANLTVDVTDTDLIALAGAQTVGNIATAIAGKVDENSGVLTNGQAWGAFDMWGVFTTHTDSHLANTVYLDSMVPDRALKITVGGTLGPAVPTGQELDWIAGLATNIMTLFNRKAEGQDSGATNFTVRVLKLPALTPNRATYIDANSNLATVVGYTGSEYVTGAGTLGVPSGSGETNPNGDAGNTNSTKVSLVYGKFGVTNFIKTEESGYGLISTNQGTNRITAVLPIFQPGDTKLTNIVGTGALTNLTVKEIDGAPNVGGVSTIRFSNATLTDDGGGQVTVTSGGATPAGADWNFQIAGVSAAALAGATNSFYDPTNSRGNFANLNVYSNLSVTPVALTQSGTNLIANGKFGSLFRAVLASSGSSGNSNLIVTNLNVGQPIEIEVFVPTGLQLNLLIEGGAAPPASWYLDGSAIALWTNGTSRIRIVNNGVSTNIFIAGPTFEFIPGANTTFQTNFVNRQISLASSGGGATTGTNFDSTYLTNQALYVPTEYNGSNGTSAVAVTNNWDMRLSTFRPVTNFVGTNLVFTLSNVTKSASIVSGFIGIGGYSNTVLLQAVAGVNIKWLGWNTNINSGGIIVRPGYSYTLQAFADRTTNVWAWVTTDDPTGGPIMFMTQNTNIAQQGSVSFWPGANITIQATNNTASNRVDMVIASTASGGAGGTNFDSALVTNQVLYIPQEFNGSNGVTATALTNNWDMALNAFKPITNYVGTNLCFTLSNITKSAALISEFIGNGSYSNIVWIRAVSGVNIKWKGYDTNASDRSGGILIRPSYSYTVQAFADRATNVSVWVSTDDPLAQTGVLYPYSTSDFVATNSTVNSNLTVNFSQLTREIYLTNNISLTNYTGMAAGLNAGVKWRVIPQLVNRTVVWPAIGNSFGMRFGTNSGSTLWTTLTNGTEYWLSWDSWNTNIVATISAFSFQ